MADDDKIRVEISKSRDVRPYTELWHAANVLEKQGVEDLSGSTWKFLSSLVLSAFCWEAFLNQAGQAILPNWPTIERSLSPKEKLKELARHAGVPVDLGKEPFKSVGELMRLRNLVAHPKPERLQSTFVVEDTHKNIDKMLGERIETDWEKACEAGEVRRIRSAVEEGIRTIHKFSNLDHHPFVSGLGSSSATLAK